MDVENNGGRTTELKSGQGYSHREERRVNGTRTGLQWLKTAGQKHPLVCSLRCEGVKLVFIPRSAVVTDIYWQRWKDYSRMNKLLFMARSSSRCWT